MKQFKNLILAGALAVGLAGFAVSCDKYGDDIDDLNKQVSGLTSTVEGLQAQLKAVQDQVNAGNYVTNVVKSGNGIVITWSNGSTSTIETIKGDKGDVVSVEIDPETKHWIIDGKDTGVVAEGKAGAGAEGAAAKSPTIDPETGNWIVYEYNEETGEFEAVDTGVSAMGGAYIVDMGAYYELHIATDETGKEFTTVQLPKLSSNIVDVDLVGTVTKDNATGTWDLTTVTTQGISYNYTFLDQATANTINNSTFVKHGGKNVKANQVLSTLGNTKFLVRIAPATLDASKLSFTLVNTNDGVAPIQLTAPERLTGIMTRAADNGLWVLSADPNVGETYSTAAAYEGKFNVGGKNIAFALQEKGGYMSAFDFVFNKSTLTKDAAVSKVNTIDFVSGAQHEVDLGKVSISFNLPQNVYDAHLDIDEATIIRWGITDIKDLANGGLSFNIGKLADNITLTEFNVTVHYLTVNGEVKEEIIKIRPKRSYTGATTLASEDILLKTPESAYEFNGADYSIAPMLEALGNDLALWKADVVSWKVTDVYYKDANGTKQRSTPSTYTTTGSIKDHIDVVLYDANWNPIAEETAKPSAVAYVEVDLDPYYTIFQYVLNTTHYVEIAFVDANGDTLSSLVVPFTVSRPTLSQLLTKEQVVFGGTSTGKAYMNRADYVAYSAKAYSLKYAFKNFGTNDDVKIDFALNGNQKFDGWKAVGDYVAIKNNGTPNVYVELTTDNTAYHREIDINIANTSRYLNFYSFTDAERAAEAFKLDIMSPIEQGTIVAAKGDGVKIVATDDGTAAVTSSDINARTYANVWYDVFMSAGYPTGGGAATEFANEFIKVNGVTFESANPNVFTVVTPNGVAAFKDDKGNVTEGYVSLKPANAGYEASEDLNITVEDIWGFKKKASIKVTITPNTGN